MPTDNVLSEAVFKSITESSYPEDEHVVSAELSSPALQSLSELLEQARVDVKKSISELSKLSATDIDGWIGQAKQLRADIEDSQQRSRDIVAFAAQGEELHRKAKDAANKVSFLRNETSFNDSLVNTLNSVKEVKRQADDVRQALDSDELLKATQLLYNSKRELETTGGIHRAKFKSILKGRIEDLQKQAAEKLTRAWSTLVVVDAANASVHIESSAKLKSVVDGLAALDLLESRIQALAKDLYGNVFQPFIQKQANGSSASIVINDSDLLLKSTETKLPLSDFFYSVQQALEYFESYLPSAVFGPLVRILLPDLVSQLIGGPLVSAIPAALDGIPMFKDVIGETARFANFLDSKDWHGGMQLLEWAHDAPDHWLLKRSQSSLFSVRQLLKRGLGRSRAVERVETQKISTQDQIFAQAKQQDDWNAEWSDDDREEARGDLRNDSEASANGAKVDDDEDVSGWGFYDDEGEKKGKGESHPSGSTAEGPAEGEEGDAWGWGDEDDNQAGSSPKKSVPAPASQTPGTKNITNGTKAPLEREITLKETYHITALPEQVLEIIILIVEDADALATEDVSSNPVAAATVELYKLPGQLLSMFRASAPNFYGSDISGNMYLYNDCLYTAEQLRSFAEHHHARSQHAGAGRILHLGDDISALELFGKRAYGREMESQRTILTDLLDGAQGFANCTDPPFSEQCDTAVSSTVDRLRDLHRQWSSVLSKSALLQAIGSLLTTATNKIIVDIEDMSDISEPESQRLTSFCNRITALDALFLPEQTAGAYTDEQPVPLTAGYCSTWLKFQYLANILESSLIDIKFLWTEGELSLEFSPDEVIDLIEALFADSEHRRKAIQEIRRGVAR